MNDLRYTLRALAKSPGFTIVAILTLALGIGANTAIFSVINSALLRSLPYPQANRLVEVWSAGPDGGHFPGITGAQFKHWREHATSFSAISVIDSRFALNFIANGHAERVAGAQTSANYFDLIHVTPFMGRTFAPGDDQVGGENHRVILSYQWWRTKFGGDPAIIGRTINLNQISYTVIGILPAHAVPYDNANFFVPLVLESEPWRMDPSIPWVSCTGRLKPDVTLAQVSAEVATLSQELSARVLPPGHGFGTDVLFMQDILAEKSRPTFLMLLGAVGLVLLIACANVANLLLVRATGRQKEMSVRIALGAGAGRIIRLMLTESVTLSVIGGALGILVASFSIDLMQYLTAQSLPGLMQPEIDGRVLAFSLILAVGTGLVFGLVPALQVCRKDVIATLKETGRGLTSAGRTRTQSFLIVSEVALTVMLLICAGLLLRSFARILNADPGFNPRQALVCDLSVTGGKFANDAALMQFERELVQRLRALPGVEYVGTSTTLPLSNNSWGAHIGRSELPVAEHTSTTHLDYISGDYFSAMGIKLLKGRQLIDADDTVGAPPVIVINEQLAASLLPGMEPLGRRLHFNDRDWEVVGVVGSVKQKRADAPAESHVYAGHAYSPNDVCLVIRTKVPPMSLVEDVRRVGNTLDPDQSIANFRSLDMAVAQSLQERRVTLYLLGGFAAAALALACLGVYGVMAYTIQQRERELGIRLALGAGYGNIISQVLRDGGRLGMVGTGIGLIGALLGGRLIASRLFEISAFDPVIFAIAPALVAIVVTVATYFPARKAAQVNPMVALRAE